MQMKAKKTVEFRLIDSNDMPPIVIKKNETDNTCVIVLNQAHTIWLGLQEIQFQELLKVYRKNLINYVMVIWKSN